MANESGSFVRGNASGRATIIGAVRDQAATYGSIGALKGVYLGGVTSVIGNSPGGSHLRTGVSKNTTDGHPNPPCLSLDTPTMWRFRWVVKTGTRSIYVSANQNSTGSLNRPSLIVRSNPSIGLNNDISGSAPDGVGWTTIGPVTFSATGTDVVWVELWNNNYAFINTPALFDHIITV